MSGKMHGIINKIFLVIVYNVNLAAVLNARKWPINDLFINAEKGLS